MTPCHATMTDRDALATALVALVRSGDAGDELARLQTRMAMQLARRVYDRQSIMIGVWRLLAPYCDDVPPDLTAAAANMIEAAEYEAIACGRCLTANAPRGSVVDNALLWLWEQGKIEIPPFTDAPRPLVARPVATAVPA